jgi:plastocyanin
MPKRALALVAVALLVAGCSGERNPAIDPEPASNVEQQDEAEVADADSKDPQAKDSQPKGSSKVVKPKSVDPRKGGFEIALGEWAVTPETPAIRPGPVTFLIHNRGTMPHGFEIELEGESSGSGSGDLFKAESELIQPGESTKMTVDLTMTGIYKIECLVDGHDDMGMEGPLEVSANAPLVKTEPKQAEGASSDTVAISNFEFQPGSIEIDAGTEVTWSNDDPAPHTVTSSGEAFDSDILDPGANFSFRFDKPGIYDYRCNVHPDMKGTVTVR